MMARYLLHCAWLAPVMLSGALGCIPKSVINDTDPGVTSAPLADDAGALRRFVFSSHAETGGVCTKILEASDPNGWDDNYLCSATKEDITWTSTGSTSGRRCTQIAEPADPNTWHDNYICVPESSSLSLRWSHSGLVRGKTCVQFSEPRDPDGWDDNYLCY